MSVAVNVRRNVYPLDGIGVSVEVINLIQVDYGLLYNWFAVDDARYITASGWHVPSLTEIATLTTYLGGTSVSGKKVKEIGTIYWGLSNTGTNEVGFNGRGNGSRDGEDGSFGYMRSDEYMWSSDDIEPPFDYNASGYKIATSNFDTSSSATRRKEEGMAVRPIKDSTTLEHGETGTYTGNDGKTYRTICIGTQEWLADNLVETKYRNGDIIPEVTDTETWYGLSTGALCAYDNDWDNV